MESDIPWPLSNAIEHQKLRTGYLMDQKNLSADYDIFRIYPSEDK
jgi:hypothetical protein